MEDLLTAVFFAGGLTLMLLACFSPYPNNLPFGLFGCVCYLAGNLVDRKYGWAIWWLSLTGFWNYLLFASATKGLR